MILNNEDVAKKIKLRMVEKTEEGYLKAEDVIKIVASPSMQAIFTEKSISKMMISTEMALRWLLRLGWSYGKLRNGMYCILMSMRGRILWNTGEVSLNVGWKMSDDSIDGTTMGQNSHAQMGFQSQVPSDAFASSQSHTTNPLSFRMTSATRDGAMRLASQNRRLRAMASC
jgi:hypothetical protein